MDLSNTIIPKGNQLNSDDLIASPRTIKITAVKAGTAEQPVAVHYEGGDGRPYLPSKSMRRVLVMLWGSEGSAYVGRRLTLYRDPTVRFGGDVVGGIKISHASDITAPVTISLTESRGKRKPHSVAPLPAEQSTHSLVNLPDGWSAMSLDQRGANRAENGIDALQAWWATISPADRAALKPTLDGTWKSIAANAKTK